MPNIRLRPIVESDRETLIRIYASTRIEELLMVPWTDEEKERFVLFQFHAQKTDYEKNYPKAQFQMILGDDQPIGRLYVDRRAKQICILDITLLPAFRGQGIGGSLLQELIEESTSTKKPLSIHVEKHNSAMRLYKRLGFQAIKDVGVYDLLERPVILSACD